MKANNNNTASVASPKVCRRDFVKYVIASGILLVAPDSFFHKSAYASEETNDHHRIVIQDARANCISISEQVKKVAPSGHLAEMIIGSLLLNQQALEDLVSEKCAAEEMSHGEMAKLAALTDSPEVITNLGSIFGSEEDSFNSELLASEECDLIIDIGDYKNEINAELNSLEAKTGLPTMYIDGDYQNLPDAFRFLGELLGCEERASDLAEMLEEIQALTDQKYFTNIRKKTVYLAEGYTGLSTRSNTSILAKCVAAAGGLVVPDISHEPESYDLELIDIIRLNPDTIVFTDPECYKKVVSEQDEWGMWWIVSAIAETRFRQSPSLLHSWLSSPPFLCQSLGVLWLAQTLYPDYFNYPLTQIAQEFYLLFFGISLTEDEIADALLETIPDSTAMSTIEEGVDSHPLSEQEIFEIKKEAGLIE